MNAIKHRDQDPSSLHLVIKDTMVALSADPSISDNIHAGSMLHYLLPLLGGGKGGGQDQLAKGKLSQPIVDKSLQKLKEFLLLQ